jgi:D-tyrosyl-tRNA(Tyr) deacylase
MRLLIQRVKFAELKVDNQLISKIGTGLLVFIGIHENDNEEQINWLAKKTLDLRIFEDENGKMNHSVTDISGEVLLVSQFTLYANCERGRRPDFTHAAPPDFANDLYEKFALKLEQLGLKPQMGIFGADMKIELLNDGPINIFIEK